MITANAPKISIAECFKGGRNYAEERPSIRATVGRRNHEGDTRGTFAEVAAMKLLCELSEERLADENELLRLGPHHFDAMAALVGSICTQRVRDLVAIQMQKTGTEHLSRVGIARDLALWLRTAGVSTQPPGKLAPIILSIVAEKVAASGQA